MLLDVIDLGKVNSILHVVINKYINMCLKKVNFQMKPHRRKMMELKSLFQII